MADTIYEVLIKFGLDDAAAKKAVSTIKQVETASASSGKAVENSSKAQAAGIDQITGKIKQQVAQYLSIGAAVGFITGAVNQYIQQAGMTQQVSRDWLVATQDIEFATTKIGGVVAAKVLPLYKELAAFISGPVLQAITDAANAADLLQKGPGQIRDAAQQHGRDVKAGDMPYEDYKKEFMRTLPTVVGAFLSRPQNILDVMKESFTGNFGSTEGGQFRKDVSLLSPEDYAKRFYV
jgi:hypothetical protein